MITLRDQHFVAIDEHDWDEYFEERAAIGEFERGMTRAEAEKAARKLAGPRPRSRNRR